MTLADLAGVPLLISAPCSHCEQISTRGSDAAVAPTWPQCGQVIRVSMSVVTATAATLHRAGVTNIETSTQAAEALKPIAGAFTFTVFAVGIIGTGLLAIPV